ncbi:hypothetical protein [Pedobacter gandavensis]|uniref:hypothetical protein n=1 Tax=Pedobacter gandavensis TaxID=2679963 RepID=UPI00292F5442|nr:hypothetical protein [Pedobacter gandavensis]
MARLFLTYLLFIFPFVSTAQSNETAQKYLENTLGYKIHTYKSSGKDTQVIIYALKFNNCTLNYNIQKKTKREIEQFTVRIGLNGLSKISMNKTKEGNYVLRLWTKGKSIIKEYADGNLVHEASQTIPMKRADLKALKYLEILTNTCKNNH